MDSYFNEARMPFIILIVGQIFAMAHLTRALLFIAIVWLLPYYAIQAPTKMRTRRRTRRESIDSTISSSSTLVEPEFESAKVKFAPNNIVHEREGNILFSIPPAQN
ncbi:hypothetical protein F5887DRAFT_1073070 [Amanita rubescens]|nr:hypothetical protein F5887DRAFT_1073070 [Amanita rubescens]